MEDSQIIDLYWQRSEAAIPATAEKYGGYCQAIARSILANDQDAEECVNDTWLRAWNAMPDQRPNQLKLFLGRLTRWLSLDRCRAEQRQKRGGGTYLLALEELEGSLAAPDTPETAMELTALTEELNRFLAGLKQEERTVFLARYWFCCPVQRIAKRHGFSESKVKVMLHRTRQKLQRHLKEEGFL